MLDVEAFSRALAAEGVQFVTGVPDSLLAPLCACFQDQWESHLPAANEGGALALAAGSWIGTGRVPVVYLQNSGIGNLVNPLMSLVHPEVYGIPVLLLIGWRGEPGRPDEPQHLPQGACTLSLLETCQVPYEVLDSRRAAAQVTRLLGSARTRKGPVALVIRKGAFAPYTAQAIADGSVGITREAAIEEVVDLLPRDCAVVATTGKAGRELDEIRKRHGDLAARDLLVVGSMGHANQIALGMAVARPTSSVCCLDGDGAVIMHMGSLAVIGSQGPSNFLHILLDNGVHDSVGGQPTASGSLDWESIARACGYKEAGVAVSLLEIRKALTGWSNGPKFLRIVVQPGARSDLARPQGVARERLLTLQRSLQS